MSKFKDEEVVILRELGYNVSLLERRAAQQTIFTVLQFVSDASVDGMICGSEKLEKNMKILIDLCDDDVGDTIISVATGMEARFAATCHTERTLRRIIDAYNPQTRRMYFTLTCVVGNDIHAKRKNSIRLVLDSELGMHDLQHALKIARKICVENLFVFNGYVE